MFITKKTIIALIAIASIFAANSISSIFTLVGAIFLIVFIIIFLFDMTSIYSSNIGFECQRKCDNRLSNGDKNTISLIITNQSDKSLSTKIVDELPDEFQIRDFEIATTFAAGTTQEVTYNITPKKRGSYTFQNVNIFVESRFKLLERKFKFEIPFTAKVYPSYNIIRNTQLLSPTNKSRELGIKNVRKIGQSMEFENIKEYVKGDDYRTINWKASARKHQLMCNVYDDEQAQQIYCIIDKGRGMQQVFNGMTLLDYSINATLALSHVALQHKDNAGLITFEQNISTHVPASKNVRQLNLIMEALYNEKTDFKYGDFANLYEYSKKQISKRSLFIVFTTFDSMVSMEQQLPFLKLISQRHTLLVVFFNDSEMEALSEKDPRTTNDYFTQTIAEKFIFEKKLIINKLKQSGIYALLSRPEQVSVNAINKYVEMKARRII